MHWYLIVLEKTPTGYSAYSPDVPGCVATGRDRVEVEQTIREAIIFHIEGLHEAKLPIPEPISSSTYVEVAA